MIEDLQGKVAVVTGAASGIGRALVDVLAGEGMAVVLADVEEDRLAIAAKHLAGDGASVAAVVTDVSDPASVDTLAEAATSRFGAVHVLCNNAGVSGTIGRAWTTSVEEWRWVLGVNIWGVINGVRSFTPILLAQSAAHVVNTASAAAFEALPGMAPYGASKHAVLGLSEAYRRELAAAGSAVGVSVLIPGGVVKTDIMSSERNWPGPLGPRPEADADPLSGLVRSSFTQAIAGGVDPHVAARAALHGIRTDAFLVCDDAGLMAEWGRHPALLAQGESPSWPPR